MTASLQLSFAVDGAPGDPAATRLHLPVEEGTVVLPELLLRPTGHPVYLYQLECRAEDAPPALAEQIGGLWNAREVMVGPPGHTLPGGVLRVGDAEQMQVTLTASIRSSDPGAANGWAAETVPLRRSIALSWTPFAVPAPGTKEPGYDGLAVIDFGTSGCTVTLWDTRVAPDPLLPASQAVQLEAALAGLPDIAAPPWLADAWASTCAEVVRQRDLYVALEVLEDRVRTAPPAYRQWLIERLHELYAATFGSAALELWSLVPVQLHGSATEIPSIITVTGTPGAYTVDVGGFAGGDITLHGLKRHFAALPSRELAAAGFDTDEVVARAVASLLDRTNAFIQRARPDDPPLRNRVLVTYPTSLPGAARTRLKRLVAAATGLPVAEINTRYDEAIAAGFYFAMRDLGSSPELGVDALLARMHTSTGSDRICTDHLLVVDIGGGTTDIALFKLTLREVTVDLPDLPPAQRGRLFEYSPDLRGSSGLANRGGDYLTWCVFHWLKAALASADLAGRELGFLSGGQAWPQNAPIPPWRDEVERIVPTRYRENPDRRAAFRELWAIAEHAKIEYLGQGEDFTGSFGELGPVTLTADGFDAIARTAVARLAELAVALVRSRFTSPDDQVDRLVLAGKASGLRQVREVFEEEFAKAFAADPDRRWDPTVLRVDPAGAKSAASTGAAWAERMRILANRPERAADVIRRGGLDIRVDVDNVFQTLPAAFTLVRGARPETIFQANEPFRAGPGDERLLWADLDQLPGQVVVHRVIDGSLPARWGSYNVANTAEQQAYAPAMPSTENDRSDDAWLASVDARLEINTELDLTLHLWHTGPENEYARRPVHVLTDTGVDLPATGDRLDQAARIRLPMGNASGQHRDKTVFPYAAKGWTHWFVHGTGVNARRLRGLLSPEPLPVPTETGWTFRITDGDEAPHTVLWRRGGPAAESGSWFAALDETGQLRVVRGHPPYLTTSTLAEMDRHPGAVLSVPMDGRSRETDSADPHNGDQ
ncbi:hypothetical protein [Actinoplanes sp. NPDC051851]|uniref:hypothetical protein n=1 Tax=Actinoplanes sp. NPDC051851 TaxID=3154753 RepID=UPI0034334C12